MVSPAYSFLSRCELTETCRDVIQLLLQQKKITLNKIRGVSGFNQGQWLLELLHDAAASDGVFNIPPREQWPVPDLYSRPLASHPLPFLVLEGGIIRRYPNPPRGSTTAEHDVGIQASQNISVRSGRGRSGSREPSPAVSTRLRDRARSRSPAPMTAPPAFRHGVPAAIYAPSASTATYNGPHPSTASSSRTTAAAQSSAARNEAKYWVVVRGLFPGLYDDKSQVKHAICRCEKPVVREFRDLGEASAFQEWIKAVGCAERASCLCGL
jgi:hypothetical protein